MTTATKPVTIDEGGTTITPRQIAILRVLQRDGVPLTRAQLSRKLLLSSKNIVQYRELIDLAAKGLIDPDDDHPLDTRKFDYIGATWSLTKRARDGIDRMGL